LVPVLQREVPSLKEKKILTDETRKRKRHTLNHLSNLLRLSNEKAEWTVQLGERVDLVKESLQQWQVSPQLQDVMTEK